MAAAAVAHPSCDGLISLLQEPEDQLRLFALQELDRVVDDHWFAAAGSVTLIEELFEDDAFPHRELAALVASKVLGLLWGLGCGGGSAGGLASCCGACLEL